MFVDSFDVQNIDGKSLIRSQLVQIVEQINIGSIEENKKLMAWSAKNFQNKFIEKISTTIAERKVELQARVHNIEELVHRIQHLYNILCDVPRFTNDF